jgi:uncharacterized protein YfaP (DUF2135 family)
MSVMIRPFHLRPLLVVAAGVALSACDAPTSLGPPGALSAVLTSVATADGAASASYHAGTAPASGAPAAPSASGTASVVTGGSASLTLASESAFERVIVGVNGLDGYYELTLPSGANTAGLVLGVASSAAEAELQLRVAVETDDAVSAYALQPLEIHHVGSGDVQISVSWSGASDVDLRVTDPSGELIYFDNPTSESGGTLDLDSNASCTIDGVNSENVVWPTGHAPHGDYKVTLVYHDDCGVARSDYVVTVAIAGQEPQAFTGAFVGPFGDNPDVEVGTFTY